MTKSFYKALAPYYKYIYPNWDASVKRQASALDSIICEFIGENAQTVLDAACGIGTQSIGLANLGYQLTASDISNGEIKQAKVEAARHDTAIEFQVADMRQTWEVYQRQFDVVIACDNSVPHLLTNEEISQAFKQFYQCTKPGGGCIITVRDYAQLERKANQKEMYPRLVHPAENGHIVMFDVWDFYAADHYEITTYLIEDAGGPDVKAEVIRGGKYYCVEIPTLERLFLEAGFGEVTVLRDRFFQPLILALKKIG
jgi:SAM-dependent methyltransferase